jgi:hypothetical protein
MSVEKVEKYKEEKARRKEILAKEKKKKMLTKIALWVLLVAVVGGIGTGVGVTVYNQYQKYLASLPDYTRTEMVLPDLAGILTEETEEAEG